MRVIRRMAGLGKRTAKFYIWPRFGDEVKVRLTKDKVVSFAWQHFLLLISLYVMTLGVAVCVRSHLGSSVISVLPYVFESAGRMAASGDVAGNAAAAWVPALTIGQYTCIMNFILVFGQILVLRRKFQLIQLFQLVIGFFFGYLIDLNMFLTTWLVPDALWMQILTQFVGCTILGFGIAFEVRCGSVTMPGEGFPVAISKVTGIEFPKVKICVDTTLVILGVAACFAFFGAWQWHIVGVGTLFAMFYVGFAVKLVGKHIGWFNKVLLYRPGFRRYVFGLARMIYKKK